MQPSERAGQGAVPPKVLEGSLGLAEAKISYNLSHGEVLKQQLRNVSVVNSSMYLGRNLAFSLPEFTRLLQKWLF